MKKIVLTIVWAALYAVCVGLGFVSNPTAGEKAVLVALSIGFFVPPYWLYFLGRKEESRKTHLILRLISAIILILTLILLIGNFLSVYFSTEVGLVLYVLLVMFSAPMMCGQYWALSLFLWACLLFLTLQKPRPDQR